MPDFHVVSDNGLLDPRPMNERARTFHREHAHMTFLRFLRAAHEAGLVVG
jgi:hypothetical protein